MMTSQHTQSTSQSLRPAVSRCHLALASLVLLLNACGGGSDTGTNASSSPPPSSTPAQGGGVQAMRMAALTPIAAPGVGQWSPLVPLSIVPVAAANLPNGKILMWSSSTRLDVGPGGSTFTTQWDPVSGTVVENRVDQTGHDMFCPGTANLPDGSILVSGGNNSDKSTLYNALSDQWSAAGVLNIPRGYHASTVLPSGEVFTLGGSWSGGQGNKHGEVWSAGTGWRRLSGVPVDLALAPDYYGGPFRSDNHMWLLSAPNGKVLHAGPSPYMNWIDTRGSGTITPAGLRGDDDYSQNGNVAMYDIGKILKVGGAPAYDYTGSSSSAYVIDINAGVSVRKIAPMAYSRMFSTSVVLPNGEVMVTGGQTIGKSYSDDFSVLSPELWNPVTEQFTTLPPMAVGRNYHSVSLLLPDGRVMSGGSGLCGDGCPANHTNVQIYSPHYLFNDDGSPAVRPVILNAPTQAVHGTTINVRTDTPVGSFALMRLASTTHTVNNDQRRVPLQFTLRPDASYDLAIPGNPGVVLPGYYMLFALDDRGVPSVSKTIQIVNTGAPVLPAIDNQTSSVGSAASLPVVATGAVSYSAQGLPPGLSIHPGTGVVSGSPTQAGQYAVTIAVTNDVATSSTRLLWTVEPGAGTEVSHVRLVALSDVVDSPWASMAEFNLLDGNGDVMSRTGWTAEASSFENLDYSPPAYAIDGNPATRWHTPYNGGSPPHPHTFIVHLGGPKVVTGFKYLPRTDAPYGVVAKWRFDTSRDGANWTTVAEGDLKDFGAITGEKVVYFNNLAQGRPATQSSTAGGDASRAVDGNINGDLAGGASVSQTLAQPNSWWQVDLGSVQPLSAVRIWNRTDCCAANLKNFVVLVSATNDMSGQSLSSLMTNPAVKHTTVPVEAGLQTTLRMPVTGRYVRVQMQGSDALALAEVQVFGASGNHAPVFAPVSPPTSVAGQALSLAFSATDTDGDPVTFAASGLPPGLTLNTVSGLVSGRPSALGAYNVNIVATDSQGAASTLSLVWTIVPAPVTYDPVPNPPTLAGGTVTLNAGAAAQGSGISYQWTFGDGTSGTSTQPSIDHVYSAPGLYAVQVSVMSGGQVIGSRGFTQAVYAPTTATRPGRSSNLAWENGPGGAGRLWMVNPDNDSVSVFDATARTRLAEIPTGASPRSVAIAPDGRVWVSNMAAATLSVIDPSSLQVVQTVPMPRASRPQGLVFAPDGGAAYVALEATGQVLRLNPGSGLALASVAVGPNPRQLAVTADSARLLVSRFITPPLPGEGTANVQTQSGGAPRGGEVVVLSTASGGLGVERTVVLQHSDKSDASTQGRGVPNYLGAAVISPDGRSAWVPSKQDNILRGTLRDGQNLDFQNTVRAISSRIDLAGWSEDLPARVDHDNASLASAAVFHPTGAYLFVALQTSRQIAVLDAARHVELMRVDAGRAPDGLAVSDDGLRLYVNNFMDRRLGIYDLSRLVTYGELSLPLQASVPSVAADKLSPAVLLGKQLFYDARDPRLARDSYMSCASCHNDGGHDGRTWDMTGLGEGLRNTISLRGRAGTGQGPLHWSGNFDEVQDFEAQIRTLSGGTGLMSDAQFNAGTRSQPLGDRKAGLSADLDALAAYVTSLDRADASPYRAPDGSLTPQAQAGRQVFSAQCASCHGGNTFTDSTLGILRDIGTLKPSSGKRLGGPLTGLDTPTLRDAWATAPYLHDGSAATVDAAIGAHANLSLTPDSLAAVVAYVRQIGSEEDSALPASGIGLSAFYFGNTSLQGQPLLSRNEAVDFDWGYAAPAAGVPADGFSVRWSGVIEAPVSGTYRLQTLSDDGVRVWVDGQLLIDNWTGHAVRADTSMPLRWLAGQRRAITVEYQELGGLGVARLQWQLPGASGFVSVPIERLYPAVSGNGLSGAYFGNASLQGSPVLIRSEPVSFAWSGAPDGVAVPADGFSVRWSGLVEVPSTGAYRLQTLSDDGVRVWVDGQLLIDNWTGHAPLYDTTAPLNWSVGQRHTLVMEYQEIGGPGTAQLLWQTPGAAGFETIPSERLYPAATGQGLTGAYFGNPNVQGTAALTRIEPIYFFWWAQPAPGLPADGFSARWSGVIEAAATGPHTLQTFSDDGVRVWVDGLLVIDNWTPHAPTYNTAAAMNWVAGERHAIIVQYQELGGPGTAQLLWRTPDAADFAPVPIERLYADAGPPR